MTRPLDLGSSSKACLLATLLGISGLMAGAVQAATLYSNDFSSTGLPNAAAQFTLDTGAEVLNYVDAGASGNPARTASVQVAGVGDADFVVSTTFTVNAPGVLASTNGAIGFGLFGTNDVFTGNAANPYYLADFNINGTAAGAMRIIALGDTSGFTQVTGIAGPVVSAGNTYELRLTGSYSGGTLSMTLQMYDDLGNPLGDSGTATDTSPLTGQYFGYRNRIVVGTNPATDVSYHDFSVTEVPEPASIVLLSMLMAAFGTRASRMSMRRSSC